MSPRRKKAEKKTTKKEQSLSDRIQNLNITRSYTSLAYGVVTVVVLFILIVVGIRTFTNQEDVDITDDAAVTEVQGEEYTVQEGQTLWEISEEVYGTGFEWERIAQANNLDNPGQIEEGMTLTIPEMDGEEDDLTQASPSPEAGDATEEQEPTQAPRATSQPSPTETPRVTPSPTEAPAVGGQGERIQGDSYTVKQGDFLWDIAVRAYGDGYRWVEIYRANIDMIANPDLIYVGQEFTIPRGE